MWKCLKPLKNNRIQTFWDFQHLGRFFCQPCGETTFSNNVPKTKINPNIVIALDLIEFRARKKFGRYRDLLMKNQSKYIQTNGDVGPWGCGVGPPS